MKAEALSIPDIVLLKPDRFSDSRGWFSETWNAERIKEFGIDANFVQDNQSYSAKTGTIRGLHCQVEPYAQGKLVRCIRGSIWDVAVDIRRDSKTFGKHVGVVLSAHAGNQLWIPSGFLHGFCTMQPDTEVLYKVTAFYDKKSERGVVWNDPQLALPWPVDLVDVVLSDKDMALSSFDEAAKWFI